MPSKTDHGGGGGGNNIWPPNNQPTNLHLVNLTNSKLFFLPSYGKWEEDVLARVHDRLRFRLFLRPTLLLRAYGKMKEKVN